MKPQKIIESISSAVNNNNSNRKPDSHTYEMNEFNSNAKNNVQSKAAEDELKRSQSVKQMITSYHRQRLTIKEALCNLDRKPSNKIIFDQDNIDNQLEHAVTKARKKPLFEDNDYDNYEDSFNVESKSHFDSEEGQKLLHLQSKFKGDKRFQLDGRFLPDKEDSEIYHVEEEWSLEEEKKNEINILEQVLGTKIKLKKENVEQKCSSGRKMLRFDPSQSNHIQYQITAPNKHNKVKIKHTEQNEKEELPQPFVSKDVFYQVHNDLKSTLESQQEFSLLQQFGETKNAESSVGMDYCGQNEKIIKKQNKFDLNTNPFRYDSSDDEPDNVQPNDSINVQESDNQDNTLKFHYEPFFFKEDDFRFQDGSDFIKRVASERNTAFVEQRRNLKHIIKAKVRNNNRKSNPFKKKLGGSKKKKLFRIKKALKR